MIPDNIFEFDWNAHLDNKLDSLFREMVSVGQSAMRYSYSHNDLDKKVNDDETLREYIVDTENEFGKPHKDLLRLSDKELNDYVMYLDSLWEVSMNG